MEAQYVMFFIIVLNSGITITGSLGKDSEGSDTSCSSEDSDVQNTSRDRTCVGCKTAKHILNCLIEVIPKLLTQDNLKLVFSALITLGTFTIGVLTIIGLYWKCFKCCQYLRNLEDSHDSEEPRPVVGAYGRGTLRPIFELIGQGGYAKVYKANRYNQSVAVKSFHPRHKAAFENEAYVYGSPSFANQYILNFICTDTVQVDNNRPINQNLVLEYHENGSLQEFLRANFIGRKTFIRMILSISLGVEHLHREILSTTGAVKFRIAHRDLKSKNILVKRNLDCCIADFGSALVERPGSKASNLSYNVIFGTPRYAAPEVLESDMETRFDFEDLLKIDIYSFSLIVWEVSNKYVTDVYSRPYHNCTGMNPSISDVREKVCVHKYRPTKSSRLWLMRDDPILTVLHGMLSKCWAEDPKKRPTAQYFRKELQRTLSTENSFFNT